MKKHIDVVNVLVWVNIACVVVVLVHALFRVAR
jgi:hypothetical protein